MKYLLVIFLLPLIVVSQDVRFTMSTYTEPYALKDGFNVGFAIDYQREVMYNKVQMFAFPCLNEIHYGDFYASMGFNQHTRFNDWRFYEGFKLGFILRNNVYPSVGFETGIEHYFNKVGIGLGCGLNYLTDTYVKRFGHTDDFDYYGRIKLIFEL